MSDLYVYLSDKFAVKCICMALIGQEHVFKIDYLIYELVTSQPKDLTSGAETCHHRNVVNFWIFFKKNH